MPCRQYSSLAGVLLFDFIFISGTHLVSSQACRASALAAVGKTKWKGDSVHVVGSSLHSLRFHGGWTDFPPAAAAKLFTFSVIFIWLGIASQELRSIVQAETSTLSAICSSGLNFLSCMLFGAGIINLETRPWEFSFFFLFKDSFSATIIMTETVRRTAYLLPTECTDRHFLLRCCLEFPEKSRKQKSDGRREHVKNSICSRAQLTVGIQLFPAEVTDLEWEKPPLSPNRRCFDMWLFRLLIRIYL